MELEKEVVVVEKTEEKETEAQPEEAESEETAAKQEKKSLKDFGYQWVDGKMVDEEGEPFKFSVYSSKRENQKRYEAIGDIVTQDIYNKLETEFGLVRTHLPVDFKQTDQEKEEVQVLKQSFLFHSNDVLTSDKLIIFINGAGVVRAGQWSRRVIMNDSLEEGTMFPYIEKAKDLGYAILCMNSNEKGISSASDTEHCYTAWTNLVSPSVATKIVIIAHSAGGVCTIVSRFL